VTATSAKLAGAGNPILVYEREAPLTLFRVTAPRFGGWPSLFTRASLKESNGRPPNRLTRPAGRGAGRSVRGCRWWPATS